MNGDPPSNINLERALAAARRRGPMLLICMVIVGASAFIFSSSQSKQYTATTSLLFTQDQLGAIAAGLSQATQPTTQSQQDTNVRLVGLGDVAERTAVQLRNHPPAKVIRNAITASPAGDTNIVNVSATAGSGAQAARIANAYSSQFVAEQQRSSANAIASAQRLISAQYRALAPADRVGPEGIGLVQRGQSLAVLARLQTGNVHVADRASVPSSPSSPKVKRDTALGLIIGLLIGAAIAYLLERFDRRIKDTKSLEEVYGLPLLASIPENSAYRVVQSLGELSATARPSRYDELFHLLRSYLRYFSVDRTLRTLMVVSAGPGEGKTTVSYNLAKAAAAMGSRVLLVEADLRRRSLFVPLIGSAGMALPDVLIGLAPMEEAVLSIDLGPHPLDILVAAETPPPNPSELLESSAMGAVLERASEAYDLVVIDTAPMTVVPDAIPLLAKVDGVLVVGRIGETRRDVADQLSKKLRSLHAPVLGVVANGVPPREAIAYGDYAQGYGDAPAEGSNGTSRGVRRPAARTTARTAKDEYAERV